MSPESSPDPTIGFSYDYMRDEPPAIQRIVEAPTHSSPYQEPPKLHTRAAPALLAPRPRSTSVPPTPTTVARMAKCYMPTTEEVTPPISLSQKQVQLALPRSSALAEEGVAANGAHNAWRRQASEPEAKLDQWIQRPRRHRPRAPCGQRKRINRRLHDPPEDRYTRRTSPRFRTEI